MFGLSSWVYVVAKEQLSSSAFLGSVSATEPFSAFRASILLTRALLECGELRTLLGRGGGPAFGPPPLPCYSVTYRRDREIQAALDSPGRDLSDEVKTQIIFRVKCDATGQVKHNTACRTCHRSPFNPRPAGGGRLNAPPQVFRG